jgi:hypothetical protein
MDVIGPINGDPTEADMSSPDKLHSLSRWWDITWAVTLFLCYRNRGLIQADSH